MNRCDRWRDSEKGALFCTIGVSKLGQFHDKERHFPDEMGHFRDEMRHFQDKRGIVTLTRDKF